MLKAIVWILALFVLSCLGYVVVSYSIVLAQRGRKVPVTATLRAAFFELLTTWGLLPFWPLFMLLGRSWESGASPGRRPIVLLHGFALTQTSWLVLGRRLASRGLGPVYGMTYFSLQSVSTSAEHLRSFVEQVVARTGAERVDIVAHSMGGVVARYYAERLGGAARLGRLITIGSPHRGTHMGRYALVTGARDLAVGSGLLDELVPPSTGGPYLSIWSRSDSIIIPQDSSSIPPPHDNRVFDDLGHLSLLASRRVVDIVVDHLR